MTAVVDASALAELVADTPAAPSVQNRVREHGGDLHLPHLAVVETASVLRGWVKSRQLTSQRASQAVDDLADFPATRWEADALLPRIWELRNNLTVYDATYVALAESLNAVLITRDARLSRGARRLSSIRFELG